MYCDRCAKQDKLETKFWPLFWRLIVAWARVLWRKVRPAPLGPSIRVFKLPRFWCGTCEKYIADVTQLPMDDLARPVVLRCHGQEKTVRLTIVALLTEPCCWTMFYKHKPYQMPENIIKAKWEPSNG